MSSRKRTPNTLDGRRRNLSQYLKFERAASRGYAFFFGGSDGLRNVFLHEIWITKHEEVCGKGSRDGRAIGGRYLATDRQVEVIEGPYEPKRTVIIEFPNREMLGKWYESAEYQEILPYRLKGARGTAIVVHGFD